MQKPVRATMCSCSPSATSNSVRLGTRLAMRSRGALKAAAALVGGGLVFAVALVLPGLVYLRGTSAVYLALTEPPPPP